MGLSKGFGSTPSVWLLATTQCSPGSALGTRNPVAGGPPSLRKPFAFPNPHFEASGGGGKRYARHAATLVAPADTGIGKHKEARPLTATTRAKQVRSPNSPNSRSADVTSCRSGGWQASDWCLQAATPVRRNREGPPAEAAHRQARQLRLAPTRRVRQNAGEASSGAWRPPRRTLRRSA